MRAARMPFSSTVLLNQGGISLDLFRQMLNFLPDDTKLMGFGYDGSQNLHYMFLMSDMFKEIKEFGLYSNITPHFIRNTDGTASCTHIDFNEAKDSNIGCLHSWTSAIGLTSSYEYCKLCNVRKV